MARKPKVAAQRVEQVGITAPAEPQCAPTTRKSRLIALLAQESGCSLVAISDVFTWKPHTTRAAIAGLRKAGHSIETITTEVGTGYRMRPATTGQHPPAASVK